MSVRRPSVMLVLTSLLVSPFSNADQQDDRAIRAKVLDYLEPYVQMRDFSGSVLVAQKGKVLVREPFGYADFEQQVPNQVNTRFHIASLTKMFTAAAVLELRNRGVLELNDPIAKFLPDYPSGDLFTIEHLLRHRAGIVNYSSLPDFANLSKKRCTLEEVVGWFRDKPLEFTPGSQHRYSNSGYVLLAYVIERTTGKAWEDFLAETIFTPVGMQRTGNVHDKQNVSGLAKGYDFAETPNLIVPAEKFDLSHKVGAGSLYSTVDDLYRWHQAVRDQKYVFTGTAIESYGWGVRNWHGQTVLTQDGSSPGCAAHFSSYIINEDLCIVILSNIKSGAVKKMKLDLAAIVLGKPFEKPLLIKRANVSTTAFEPCLGRYRYDAESIVTIVRDGGAIAYQWRELPYLQPLTPVGPTRFFARGIYKHLEFSKRRGDVFEHLTFGKTPCPRIE